jgi:hypothetical protein
MKNIKANKKFLPPYASRTLLNKTHTDAKLFLKHKIGCAYVRFCKFEQFENNPKSAF